MKEGTENRLKFKKLKRRLRLPEWQAVGLLETIWKLARTSAQAGDIGRYSNEDIAAAIEYEGDADELVQCLVDCGWFDEDPEFRLVIHDWSEHVPSYLKGNFSKHKKQFADEVAKQRAKQGALPPPEPPPPNVHSEVPEQGATKSSLVKPSQVKPSPHQTGEVCERGVLSNGDGLMPAYPSPEFAEAWGLWLQKCSEVAQRMPGRNEPSKLMADMLKLAQLRDEAKAIAWITHSVSVSSSANLCDPHRYDKHPPGSEAAENDQSEAHAAADRRRKREADRKKAAAQATRHEEEQNRKFLASLAEKERQATA